MTKRYEGRCHCGKIKFAFRSEPITNAKRCNCSICKRKGAVMSSKYIPAADFEPHADMSLLEDYRWQDRDVNHLFCKTCGIYPYHGDSKMGYRVNLGCVDDIDVFALEISVIDGKAM
jgi:hypothetical protein